MPDAIPPRPKPAGTSPPRSNGASMKISTALLVLLLALMTAELIYQRVTGF
jgi:hypothetical protein